MVVLMTTSSSKTKTLIRYKQFKFVYKCTFTATVEPYMSIVCFLGLINI